MANTRNGNVIFVDTTDTVIPGPLKIEGIKYIGAASSSARLRAGTSSGAELWRESAATNVFDDVCISVKEQAGVHIALTGTAVVYIYLE